MDAASEAPLIKEAESVSAVIGVGFASYSTLAIFLYLLTMMKEAITMIRARHSITIPVHFRNLRMNKACGF